jgi:uncharacterized membrane protein YidH (DUF202 family)
MNSDLHLSMAQRESESHSRNSQPEHPDNFEAIRLRTISTSTQQHNGNDDEFETIELDNLGVHTALHDSPSSASLSSGEYRVTSIRTISRSSRQSSVIDDKGPFGPLRRFWLNHVAIIVPEKGNRDHFALERTFLSYIRTSAAFSMQGVLVAQLFRIRETRKSRFNFYSVGIPLSVAFHSCAILIALLAAHRFWRQQGAIARGKVYAGGWELNITSLLSAGVSSDIRCSSS